MRAGARRKRPALKILVVYENSLEEEVAERVTRVIPGFVRDLVQSLTIMSNRHADSIPLTARHLSFKEVVDPIMMDGETRDYITALEKAVFVKGGALQ